jgi:hypothetical protein
MDTMMTGTGSMYLVQVFNAALTVVAQVIARPLVLNHAMIVVYALIIGAAEQMMFMTGF